MLKIKFDLCTEKFYFEYVCLNHMSLKGKLVYAWRNGKFNRPLLYNMIHDIKGDKMIGVIEALQGEVRRHGYLLKGDENEINKF